jgi:hypothetical protein
MHSDSFDEIETLEGRWQHGENVGYCYPSGLEKTLCKWDVYVLLVTKGLTFWRDMKAVVFIKALLTKFYFQQNFLPHSSFE